MTYRAKKFDCCNILSQKKTRETHVLYELTTGLIHWNLNSVFNNVLYLITVHLGHSRDSCSCGLIM